jgi:hypothetical protein
MPKYLLPPDVTVVTVVTNVTVVTRITVVISDPPWAVRKEGS